MDATMDIQMSFETSVPMDQAQEINYSENNNKGLAEQRMDDPELEAIKARVREMEEEAEKLKKLHSEIEQHDFYRNPLTATSGVSLQEKLEADSRSIYVGNVDYAATATELEQYFSVCGPVSRVTILFNKQDGHPKGYAYVEFADKDSVNTAMALDDSLFRGRQIKVMPKRTNRPGLGTSVWPPRSRGRGFRGGRGYGGTYRPTRRPRRPSFSPY